MGKHNNGKTTGFKAVADKAAKEYGSKAAGERVAGAVKAKMAKAGQLEEGHCSACDCSPCECDTMEESALQAAFGEKKYGDKGMKALQKAGREGASDKTMSNIRKRYDKYDESQGMAEGDMEEGAGVMHFKAQQAKAAGDKTFKMGDKTFPVQEGHCSACDCSPCECNKHMSSDINRISELAGLGKGMMDEQAMAEDLQADDGKHYDSFADFISRFDPDLFDETKTYSAGREIRGYINGRNVMSWEFDDEQHDDESNPSGWGNYDMTMLEDDELQRRIGINAVNKHPRPGQTNYSEIPAGNHPRSRNRYSDEYRSSQPERLKHSIRASLGKHAEPNLPESMASMLNRLDELAEGADQAVKKSPAEWLRDPALKQAKSLQATGLGLDDPAKGFRSFDNYRGPDMSQASDPAHFEEFLNAFARVPGAIVTAFMSAAAPQPVAESTKKQNKGNDGNLANNAKPYDKVTRGDVIAGRLGKDEMGGKEQSLKELDLNLLKGAQGAMRNANPDTESERNRHKKYGYRSDRDDTGNDNDYDEYGNLKNKKKSAASSDGPKKKGRPAKEKQPERVTGKSYKYKSGRPSKTAEGLDSDGVMMTRPSNMSSESIGHGEQAEYNDEAGMAKDSLHTIVRSAKELERALRSNENLPEWVQEKIGQIKGMMSSVTDYILSTHERDAEQHMGREGITIEPVAEKAVSKNQAVAARIARGVQKGEVKAQPGSASAEMSKMAPKELKKFAKTPTKGLPKQVEEESTGREDQRAERAGKRVAKDIEHDEGHRGRDDNRAEKAGKKVTKDIEYDDKKDRKEKKVDETTTSGSVAPAQNAAPKAGKGMQFGKGVYESLDRQFKQAQTESIAIESTMQECGNGEMAPAITITADGDEAAKLMMLLKLAGLENQIPSACPSCGGSSCGCAEMMDENAPDWPTNTETLSADPNLRTYSGGLNGPKSTGQSTTPVLASQLRRQASMEESVKLEQSLFDTWKKYKG
jgi:hypothetical protein